MIRANLGNRYFRKPEGSDWARADEMEAQRGARPSPEKTVLQKSLRPKPCDWVDYRLPLENPAGHREAKCRIEQMHLPHRHPPIRIDLGDPSGEEATTTSLSAQ